jgi:NhaA family Na+:H+ antiporter
VSAYAVLGLSLWYVMFHSGIHATLAGVLIALAIPAKAKLERFDFAQSCRKLLADFEGCSLKQGSKAQAACETATIHTLRLNCERVEPTLVRLEHSLHPWVAFAIVPLFALANAGVVFNSATLSMAIGSSVSWGIFLGLLLGNQIGINLFCWLAVRLRLAELPAGVGWLHIYGTSWLAAIGFTMSLFIAGLAFDSQDPALMAQAKIGILMVSLLSGVVGWLLLRRAIS